MSDECASEVDFGLFDDVCEFFLDVCASAHVGLGSDLYSEAFWHFVFLLALYEEA